MKSLSPKRILLVLGLVLLIVVIFGGGWWLGYRTQPSPPATPVDLSLFWQAWKVVDDKYVPNINATTTKPITVEDRVWGATSGMVDSLGDPYSTFLPPKENKLFNQEIDGNFGGVGMEVGVRDKVLTVVAPLKGTPSERVGIKAGDKIIQIDDTASSKLPIEQAIGLIRGEVGTTVRLKILRGPQNTPFDFKVVRANIDIPTLDTQMLPKGVFLIRLYNFSAPAPDLFRKALRQFIEARSDKLIIDLRGNPGGYLEAAVDLASWFLPASQTVVIEDYGGKKEPRIYRSRGYDVFNDRLKLAILVDGGSASASEILAGALREHGRATLVGEKTFGKGSVQELIPVDGNAALKLTVARWLTPKGVSLSHDGLTPDVVVKGSDKKNDYGTSLDVTTDPQLAKAVELLLKK